MAILGLAQGLGFGVEGLGAWIVRIGFSTTLDYLNLPNPTFLSVLIINPNMVFIGTRQKSRFWWVKVYLYQEPEGIVLVAGQPLREVEVNRVDFLWFPDASLLARLPSR